MKIILLITQAIISFFLCTTTLSAALNGEYLLRLTSGTQTEVNNIAAPLVGMMVYNTTIHKINYYNGVSWITLSGDSVYTADGQLAANRNVDINTHTLAFTNGKIGIGDITPDATLDVNGSFRVDGAYYDKDGDAGTAGQILTSSGGGIDWTSSASVPYISNSTISVAASSAVTIVLNGDNFIPSSSVAIPGFDGVINSINVISPMEIQVDITTGAANTFDIVISNNGILNTQWVSNGVGLLQVN